MSSDKKERLAAQGLLNRKAHAVVDPHFVEDDFFDAQDVVQVRYEMLRSVRAGERTATDAAAVFGVSRATYYEVLGSFERGGVGGLVPLRRGPHGAHKLTDEVMVFVSGLLEEDRKQGFERLAAAVKARFQRSVHPRSIERALKQRKKNRSR